MKAPAFTRALALAVLPLIAVPSCGSQEAELRANALAETIREQQVEHFVRTFSVSAPTRAVEQAEANAHAPSIRALVEQGRLNFEPDPVVRELVTLLFAERDYEHLFVYGSRLTPDGRAVAERLINAMDEGLDPTELHGEIIAAKRAELGDSAELTALLNELQLSNEDEDTLLAHMLGDTAIDGTLPAADAIFAKIAQPSADNPLPRYAQAIEALTEQMEVAAETAPELELILAAGFIRYAVANRHDNLGYVTPERAAANGWDLEDESQRDEIVRDPDERHKSTNRRDH